MTHAMNSLIFLLLLLFFLFMSNLISTNRYSTGTRLIIDADGDVGIYRGVVVSTFLYQKPHYIYVIYEYTGFIQSVVLLLMLYQT